MLIIESLFTGYIDFWGGNGCRQGNNSGCLFAWYGPTTTLRECVDAWVDDFSHGGDFDEMVDDINKEDVRAAILQSFSPKGLADYNNGALCGPAEDITDAADIEDEDCGLPVWILLLTFEPDKKEN